MSNDTYRNNAHGNVTANGNYPRAEGVIVRGAVNMGLSSHSGTGTFTPQRKDPVAGWVDLDDEGTDVEFTGKDSRTFGLIGTNRVRFAVTSASSLDADYFIEATNTIEAR